MKSKSKVKTDKQKHKIETQIVFNKDIIEIQFSFKRTTQRVIEMREFDAGGENTERKT